LLSFPIGVAVSPDGSKVYVTNRGTGTVSVIDTATNIVIATIPVGLNPIGVAVKPNGSKVYVATDDFNTRPIVSVIDTATNIVIATIAVGLSPNGVAVKPDGSKVYVASFDANTVSVIDTATNIVIATIPVGNGPTALLACLYSRRGRRCSPAHRGLTTVKARVSPRWRQSL
jgi:YVTN family beta-propeller protein